MQATSQAPLKKPGDCGQMPPKPTKSRGVHKSVRKEGAFALQVALSIGESRGLELISESEQRPGEALGWQAEQLLDVRRSS